MSFCLCELQMCLEYTVIVNPWSILFGYLVHHAKYESLHVLFGLTLVIASSYVLMRY